MIKSENQKLFLVGKMGAARLSKDHQIPVEVATSFLQSGRFSIVCPLLIWYHQPQTFYSHTRNPRREDTTLILNITSKNKPATKMLHLWLRVPPQESSPFSVPSPHPAQWHLTPPRPTEASACK